MSPLRVNHYLNLAMLAYWEHISMKFELKYHFMQEKRFENTVCEMVAIYLGPNVRVDG